MMDWLWLWLLLYVSALALVGLAVSRALHPTGSGRKSKAREALLAAREVYIWAAKKSLVSGVIIALIGSVLVWLVRWVG